MTRGALVNIPRANNWVRGHFHILDHLHRASNCYAAVVADGAVWAAVDVIVATDGGGIWAAAEASITLRATRASAGACRTVRALNIPTLARKRCSSILLWLLLAHGNMRDEVQERDGRNTSVVADSAMRAAVDMVRAANGIVQRAAAVAAIAIRAARVARVTNRAVRARNVPALGRHGGVLGRRKLHALKLRQHTRRRNTSVVADIAVRAAVHVVRAADSIVQWAAAVPAVTIRAARVARVARRAVRADDVLALRRVCVDLEGGEFHLAALCDMLCKVRGNRDSRGACGGPRLTASLIAANALRVHTLLPLVAAVHVICTAHSVGERAASVCPVVHQAAGVPARAGSGASRADDSTLWECILYVQDVGLQGR